MSERDTAGNVIFGPRTDPFGRCIYCGGPVMTNNQCAEDCDRSLANQGMADYADILKRGEKGPSHE